MHNAGVNFLELRKGEVQHSPPDRAKTAGEEARREGGPVLKGKKEREDRPKRCDTHNPMTAKRAPPLPGDHNQLSQGAIFNPRSAPVRRAYPRRAITCPACISPPERLHSHSAPTNEHKRNYL